MTEDEINHLLAIGAQNAEKFREQQGLVPERERAPPPVEHLSRVRRCQRCQQIYEEERPRTQAEIEQLHRTLFIGGDDCHVELRFCDSCYVQVVETPMRKNNESTFDVGGSNIQPPNLLLQRAYPVR